MSTINPIIERECRLVLQLITPLHIGSGEPDGSSDAGVVRDFNGLPGIPGTSIQGMLRAAVGEASKECDPGATERIFGQSSRRSEGTERGGRLGVSWGVVHSQHNQPVDGRITSSCRDNDPVLHDAARPMLRDHVKLNERGVADGRGKFDELVVSAGHRFTVCLRFVTSTTNDVAKEDERIKNHPGKDRDWHILMKVLGNPNMRLCQPNLRLGGKTRRGLGTFKVVHWNETTDTNQHGLESTPEAVEALELPSLDNSLSCTLTPESLWMFGGGTSESADSAPVRGTRIVWEGSQGRVQPVWLIPGTAVKGALRHRTKFHANRLARNFADDPNPEKSHQVQERMDELFGCVAEGTGKPGKVFIDDLTIDLPSGGNGGADPAEHLAPVQNHVAINPFTGGAKDGALFNDEPLRPRINSVQLRVQLRGKLDSNAGVQECATREALEAAIKDLMEGRLAVGAHAGRGYGIFRNQNLEDDE